MSGLLLGFYGDDFTGSTDVMEALAKAGLRTVLFLQPPTPVDLSRFPGIRAVGVAGVSRSLPTGRMETELRPVFESLRDLGAPLVHYKVCSTFDSSPATGSIGRAIEIGQKVFEGLWVPLVVGAPALGRYCVFGNLFARSGPETEPFRLDRHPTMSRHPVTPMNEADIRRVLAAQTDIPVQLVDVLSLAAPEAAAARLTALIAAEDSSVVLFDGLTDAHMAVVGQLIWDHAARTDRPLFAVGSSGLEYALTATWRERGQIPVMSGLFPLDPVEKIIVASGSCSPVTAGQIARALAQDDFQDIPLPPEAFTGGAGGIAARDKAVEDCLNALNVGKSPLVHAACGPDDTRIPLTRQLLESEGGSTGERIGTVLGTLVRTVLQRTTVRRAVITGGDTSGYAARALGIDALEMAAPVAPGSPLCRVASGDPAVDKAEILFKGGQVGKVDLFARVRSGTP